MDPEPITKSPFDEPAVVPIAVDQQLIEKPAFLIELMTKIFVFVIVIAVYLTLTNLSSYVNVYPFCKISLEQDVLEGNSQTITAALTQILQQDPKSYQTVCQYVSTITEDTCLIANSPISQSDSQTQLAPVNEGCYVKGTKNIYLTPTKDTTDQTVTARADAIKKYAELSKSFWESQ